MKKTALVCMLLWVLAAPSVAGPSPTTIPTGAVPTIDGTLGDEEWKEAHRVDLQPGGEAWLIQDETALYVGVRAGRNCIPSLALLRDQKVLVLHASASLGTAEYERSGDGWKATRSFSWRCRDGSTKDADRDGFLEDEGWFATTCGVGRRGEAEYRIERRLLSDESVRLSLVVCRLQPGSPTACVWPTTIDDGTKSQDLLFGRTPALDFDPETWALLDLGAAGSPADRFADELGRLEALAEDDPVGAYVALLDLLDENEAASEGRERATRLRRTLEKQKPVAREAAAQRRLDSALKLLLKKLREVETRHPGTRAARIAAAQRAALDT